MLRFIFLLLSCHTSIGLCQNSLMEKNNPYIMIEPVTSRKYGYYVIKRELDPLNLTCTVYNSSERLYFVSWMPPRSASNSKNHYVTQMSQNSATLVITHLKSNDEGTYFCKALPPDNSLLQLQAEVVVNIINGRECGETMFTCNLSMYNNCIHRRFTCDGFKDCEMGEDEDQDMCGPDPCTNKLPCQDHVSVVRCIPKAWCCNIKIDVNCTVREPLSCCHNSFQKFMDDRSYYNTLKPHYYDMAFAIYTVIGCAVVFMVVVTVLVIAICRVYTRTQWPNNLPPRPTHLNENAAAMYEVDMYCGGPPGLLVTYNIGQELQTVGQAVQPPPYSQVVAIPPKQGPPPPYTPLDMPEAEALLNESFTQRINNDEQNGATPTEFPSNRNT